MAGKMVIIEDKRKIYEMLTDKSIFISNYIEDSDSQFILYYKYLTHSDLPTFGKATKPNMLYKNILYYLTTEEMHDIEERNKKPFETAHQSNIGLPKRFWKDLGMGDPRETVKGASISEKTLNNYANVFLVNDTLKYFTKDYSLKVFNKLGKEEEFYNKWQSEECDFYVNHESPLTEIKLTQAVHGIGVSTDEEFHKLRHHMFKNDILFLLIEKSSYKENNLFILPYKNPKFYTIIGESNYAWEQYMLEEHRRLEQLVIQEEIVTETDEQYRKHQEKWRNLLAEEMMNYTINDDEVFCPLTGISANFENVGTIFRASHIKPYKDCLEEEKYDINNGLFLIANADALFDKHLITIDENKEIVFSFLLANDRKLISQLLLNQPIFKDILNEQRMKYLAIHKKTFDDLEIKRKTA